MQKPPASQSLECYLPGCYRNLPCESGESLAGYLARLAEANGYPGIRALLRAAALPCSGPVRTHMLTLYQNRAQLERLSRMAVGDPQHLERFACDPLPNPLLMPTRMQPEALFGTNGVWIGMPYCRTALLSASSVWVRVAMCARTGSLPR
jgi:hypothetical protein